MPEEEMQALCDFIDIVERTYPPISRVMFLWGTSVSMWDKFTFQMLRIADAAAGVVVDRRHTRVTEALRA